MPIITMLHIYRAGREMYVGLELTYGVIEECSTYKRATAEELTSAAVRARAQSGARGEMRA
jgi:hypothetical protein